MVKIIKKELDIPKEDSGTPVDIDDEEKKIASTNKRTQLIFIFKEPDT